MRERGSLPFLFPIPGSHVLYGNLGSRRNQSLPICGIGANDARASERKGVEDQRRDRVSTDVTSPLMEEGLARCNRGIDSTEARLNSSRRPGRAGQN